MIHTLDVLEVIGIDDVKIAGIQSDSRKVEDGFVRGGKRTAVDGHAYIDEAIAKGAVAVVCGDIPSISEEMEILPRMSFFIRVKDSADALGKLVSTWYDNPSG